MRLPTLAAKNLKRHRIRTVLTVTGISVSALMLFTILSFNSGYDKALKEEMASTGVHMYVSMEGCPMQAASLILHGGEIPSYLEETMLKEIQSSEGVKVAGGYLIATVITDGKADLFYGITPEVRKLKPYWKLKGSWFEGADSIILGADVARDARKRVGDFIFLESLGRKFCISGILEKSGKEDDGFYFMPIETQQEIFNKRNKLTAIGIQLTEISQLDKVKTMLERQGAYVVPQQEITDLVQDVVGGTKSMLLAILIIILLVAGLGVFNTVLMATFERKEEFGYMRSIGARRGVIFQLILVETLWLCAAGLAVGIGAGFASALGLDKLFRGFVPYVPAGRIVRPDLLIVVISSAVVVGLGVLAAMYPGYKASKVSPIEAIRNP